MLMVPMSCGVPNPFSLDALSRPAFAHAGWTQAERRALLSVANRERLLLLGQPGTGKSRLLRSLDRTLTSQDVSVRRFNSGDPLEGLTPGVVLLIDEAASLSVAECKHLSCVRNPIIMCGLPSLPERLSLCPDDYHCVTLQPLTHEEVARFIIARLHESGRPRATFTPEAMIAVAQQSSGLMRLVIVLAGAAAFFAEQRGAVNVAVDDVAEAVSMRSITPEELEQPAALDKGLQTGRAISQAPELRQPWLGPAAVRGWHWNRIAGTTAFVCASLVVVGVTVLAALHLDAIPPLASEDLRGRPVPPLASSAAPDLASPVIGQLTLTAPVQLAAVSPPPQADTTSSPTSAPLPSPEVTRIAAPTSRVDDPKMSVVAPAFSAWPPSSVSRAATSATTLAFDGPIMNETMGQSGHLSLQLHLHGMHGPVNAVFHASKGLIGSGVLTGDVGNDGQITLSGRLMMGPNPYDCALTGALKGEQLIGAATFTRATSGLAAHSKFTLSRL